MRRAHVPEGAELRMRQRHERAACLERRVAFDEVLDVLHDAGGDALRLQGLDQRVVFLRGVSIRRSVVPPASCARRCHVIRRESADRHPAILAARRIDVLLQHARVGIAGALRPTRRAAVATIASRICCTQISYIAASMWQPRPDSLRRCQCRGDAGRHHVGHDHVAIGHRARDHRVAVGPAGQQRAAGQCGAGAVHAPFLCQRTGLSVDAARSHHQAGIALRQLFVVRAPASPSCRARNSRRRRRPSRSSGSSSSRRFRPLQVERQAALGSIEVREPGLVVEVAGAATRRPAHRGATGRDACGFRP